jgi:hypothetical protein
MWGEAAGGPDWRDSAAYAPLLDADRSLFAWEWLRRDSVYCAAAEQALDRRSARCAHPAAAAFGLVGFEAPHRAVPDARPMWRSDVHPYVLSVAAKRPAEAADVFDLHSIRAAATIVRDRRGEHLLLSDGLRTIRLDGAPLVTSSLPVQDVAGERPGERHQAEHRGQDRDGAVAAIAAVEERPGEEIKAARNGGGEREVVAPVAELEHRDLGENDERADDGHHRGRGRSGTQRDAAALGDDQAPAKHRRREQEQEEKGEAQHQPRTLTILSR